MSFLSLSFFVLFIFTFYIYWNLPEEKPFLKRILILIASFIFYGYFSIPFLIHFLVVVLLNFFLYKLFFSKNVYLKLTISLNVINLLVFKYFYFLLDTIGKTFQLPGLQSKQEVDLYISNFFGISDFQILLPMTISYYTFQLISLAVDVKNQKYEKELSLLDFLSYTFFFPVMIAGPILRIGQILPQFTNPQLSFSQMMQGIWLILRGIFKKAVLSDSLLGTIAPVFQEPSSYSGGSLLVTTYFFGAMLYLDFSGLTDIARGLSYLLGIELPENFKAPFFMQGFGDFWRRWHLTFSYWIRDYIYIPLGGSRVSEPRIYLNFIITFALGGLWHGANLNFLLWGAINGLYIAIERSLEQRKIGLPDFKGKTFLKYLIVLHLSMITWVLFFTPDLNKAFIVVNKILTLSEGAFLTNTETGIYAVLFTFLFHLGEEFPEKFARLEKARLVFTPILAFILIVFLVQQSSANIDFFYEKF